MELIRKYYARFNAFAESLSLLLFACCFFHYYDSRFRIYYLSLLC